MARSQAEGLRAGGLGLGAESLLGSSCWNWGDDFDGFWWSKSENGGCFPLTHHSGDFDHGKTMKLVERLAIQASWSRMRSVRPDGFGGGGGGGFARFTQSGIKSLCARCPDVYECIQGSLKDTFCPFEAWLFPPN